MRAPRFPTHKPKRTIVTPSSKSGQSPGILSKGNRLMRLYQQETKQKDYVRGCLIQTICGCAPAHLSFARPESLTEGFELPPLIPPLALPTRHLVPFVPGRPRLNLRVPLHPGRGVLLVGGVQGGGSYESDKGVNNRSESGSTRRAG